MNRTLRNYVTLIFLLCTTIDLFAQQAFYVYKNDSTVNGFITSDIDSIVYSVIDIDSTVHNSYRVQEIWAYDSVYRIPLDKIDSISFVTPRPVFQPDVIDISESLMPYIIGCDSLALSISLSTPTKLIPKTGDKIATMQTNTILPYGFAGQVSEIRSDRDRTIVLCDTLFFEDIFKTYYNVTSVYGYSSDSVQSKVKDITTRATHTFNEQLTLPTFTIRGDQYLERVIQKNDDLAIQFNSSWEDVIKPTVHVTATVIRNEDVGFYVSANITGNITHTTSFSASGGVSWSNDFLNGNMINIPLERIGPVPFLSFYINAGLFINAEANISTSVGLEQHYTVGWGIEASSNGLFNINPIQRANNYSVHQAQGYVEGRFAFGGYIEGGLNFASRYIGRICMRQELGAELVGDLVLTNNDIAHAQRDTTLYARLKASSIDLNAFYSQGYQASILDNQWHLGQQRTSSLTLQSWSLVPTFSNVSLKPDDNALTSIIAKAQVGSEHQLLAPLNFGLALYDEDGAEKETFYDGSAYRYGNMAVSKTFENINLYKDYTVYPIVRILGFDIKASPSSKTKIEPAPETYGTGDVTSYSAIAYGKCTFWDQLPGLTAGICYAPTDDSATWVYVEGFKLGDGLYQASIYGLEANKQYKYRAYIVYNGQYVFGEEKTFKTTSNIGIFTSDFTLSDNLLTIKGSAYDLPTGEDIEFGFLYGSKENREELENKTKSEDVTWTGNTYANFSLNIPVSKDDESLYYCAYVYVDSCYYYGNVQKAVLNDENKEGLKYFFETAGGNNWKENFGWAEDNIPTDSWYGVGVYQPGTSQISLADNNLSGNAILRNVNGFDKIDISNNSALTGLSIQKCEFPDPWMPFIKSTGSPLQNISLTGCKVGGGGELCFVSERMNSLTVGNCSGIDEICGYWALNSLDKSITKIKLEASNITISECPVDASTGSFQLRYAIANNVSISNMHAQGYKRIAFDDCELGSVIISNSNFFAVGINKGNEEFKTSPTKISSLTIDNVSGNDGTLDVSNNGSISTLTIRHCGGRVSLDTGNAPFVIVSNCGDVSIDDSNPGTHFTFVNCGIVHALGETVTPVSYFSGSLEEFKAAAESLKRQ